MCAAVLHAEILRHGDLHVVHRVAVPERLEDRIGEPERQQILHRLFAEIVVDAVDLRFVEVAVQQRVQGPGGVEVVAERFFEDHAHPAAALQQSRRIELLHRAGHGGRRQREIKDPVLRKIARDFQPPDEAGQRVVVGGIAFPHRLVVQMVLTPLSQLARIPRAGASQALVGPEAKRLFAQLRQGGADDQRVVFLQLAVRA
jgi:hypothetical protein